MTDFHAVSEEEHAASVEHELGKLRVALDGNRGGRMPRRHHHAKELYEYFLFRVGWDAKLGRPFTREECVDIEEGCGRHGPAALFLMMRKSGRNPSDGGVRY